MMADARRGQFDVVLVWACDRLARSVRHFLEVLDEFNHLGVEFVSWREQLDTGGPLGRAVIVIIGAIAELERSLIVERVRAGTAIDCHGSSGEGPEHCCQGTSLLAICSGHAPEPEECLQWTREVPGIRRRTHGLRFGPLYHLVDRRARCVLALV